MTKIRPAFEDADIPAKPQLHTRKHHHAYNGARGLPIFTCVKSLSTTITILLTSTSTSPSSTATSEEAAKEPDRYTHGKHDMEVINETRSQASSSPASSTPVSKEFTESTESEESAEALYQVKLYYPQNRACTIYRSWDDFILLRRGLNSTRYKSLPGSDDDNGAVICTERHSHDYTCLHEFLKYVMERCSTSKAEPAVEYFLRRRMDDCDGGGSGSDFGYLVNTLGSQRDWEIL
ncbi:hypothetical protein V8F33_000068 [Rhypophila sp. PSN 637]